MSEPYARLEEALAKAIEDHGRQHPITPDCAAHLLSHDYVLAALEALAAVALSPEPVR